MLLASFGKTFFAWRFILNVFLFFSFFCDDILLETNPVLLLCSVFKYCHFYSKLFFFCWSGGGGGGRGNIRNISCFSPLIFIH